MADRIDLLAVVAELDQEIAQLDQQGGEAALVCGPGWRLDGDVLIEAGPDGDRFTKVCVRHQRAGLRLHERDLAEGWCCSMCVTETEQPRAVERYRALHRRLAEGKG